jgi:hypothetical protein
MSTAVSPVSLGHSHQLKHVAVWIFEVDASASFQSLSSPSFRLPGALPYESPAFLIRSKIASNSASLSG